MVRGAHRAGRGDDLRARWVPALRAGGLDLQVLSVWTDERAPREAALRTVLECVDAVLVEVEAADGELVLVERRADLDRPGLKLLLALEGGEALGEDLAVLRSLHRLGLRMLGLTYNARNALGDGAGEPADGGLTGLGREAVALCEELGIVVDLAHAGERTFTDAVEAARQAPVVSHAGCRALQPIARNVSDEQLAAVAWAGVALHPSLLGSASPAEHVHHALARAGSGRVGTGSDFCAPLAEVLGGRGPELFAAVDGLAGPEDLPALDRALRATGLGEAELAEVRGESLARVLRSRLPA